MHTFITLITNKFSFSLSEEMPANIKDLCKDKSGTLENVQHQQLKDGKQL